MPQSLRRSDSFDLARERGILIPTSRSGSCMSGHCNTANREITSVNMANNEINTRKAAAPLAIIKFLELVSRPILWFFSFRSKMTHFSACQRVVLSYITTVSMTEI